jgi:hypothetical protein
VNSQLCAPYFPRGNGNIVVTGIPVSDETCGLLFPLGWERVVDNRSNQKWILDIDVSPPEREQKSTGFVTFAVNSHHFPAPAGTIGRLSASDGDGRPIFPSRRGYRLRTRALVAH